MRSSKLPGAAMGIAALGLIAAALLAVAYWWLYSLEVAPAVGSTGVLRSLPTVFNVNDIGVTDINDDGHLDIFTTNHRSDQLFCLNDGNGTFECVHGAALGLEHDPSAPYLVDRSHEHSRSAPRAALLR